MTNWTYLWMKVVFYEKKQHQSAHYKIMNIRASTAFEYILL